MGMMPEWLAKPPAFEAFDQVFSNPSNYIPALEALQAPGADLATLVGAAGHQVSVSASDKSHFLNDWLGMWWSGLNPPVEERLRVGLIGAMQEALGPPRLPMEFVWVCGGPLGWSPPPQHASRKFFEVGWTKSPNQITFIVSTNFEQGMILAGNPQPAWYLDSGLNVQQVQ